MGAQTVDCGLEANAKERTHATCLAMLNRNPRYLMRRFMAVGETQVASSIFAYQDGGGGHFYTKQRCPTEFTKSSLWACKIGEGHPSEGRLSTHCC